MADRDALFIVKTKHLSLPAIKRLRAHSIPSAGNPPTPPQVKPSVPETLPPSDYNLLKFKGGFAVLLAVIGLLSGELSPAFHGMPSGRLDPDDPGAFYSMIVLTGITGVIMVLSGAIGSSRKASVNAKQSDGQDPPG